MSPQELLLELRDIDAPAQPAWWLLAPFWQLTIALIVIVVAVAWLYRRRRRQHRRYREARKRLDRIRRDYHRHAVCVATLQALSAWLKQVAMAAFPESRIAALSGQPWFDFLCRSTPTPVFEPGLRAAFTTELYRESVELDLNPAIDACERWLVTIRPRLRRRGGPGAAA